MSRRGSKRLVAEAEQRRQKQKKKKDSGMRKRLTWAWWILVPLLLLCAEVQFAGTRPRAVGLAGGDGAVGLGASAARSLQQQKTSEDLDTAIDDNGKTETVTNCSQLQQALRKDDVTKILIDGNLTCTRKNWPMPIVVRRNVEVAGAFTVATPPENGGTGFEDTDLDEAERAQMMNQRTMTTTELLQYSIDWSDVSKVLVMERGALAYFHDLLMFQADMGIGGLDLQFVHTRKGATGVFAGLLMVVESCPQPVSSYDVIINELQRPEFLAGDQSTFSIEPHTLVVKDVAIWWPNINSLWQICNTVFECDLQNREDPQIGKDFSSDFVSPMCHSDGDVPGNGPQPPIDFDERSDDRAAQDGDGGNDSLNQTWVLMLTVLGFVIFVAMMITCCVVLRCRRRRSRGRMTRGVELARSKKGENGHNSKSKSFAYDLFEKNINVPLQDVEIGTLLGRGGFGKVYKGTWKGTTVAIKVIEHGERLMENDLKLPFEAYLSKRVSHPNVVQTFIIHTRQQDSPHGVTVDTMDLNESNLQQGVGQSSLMSTHDIFSNMARGSAVNEGTELFETWLVLEYCDRGSLSKAVKKGLLCDRCGKPVMDHVLLSALDVANAMNYLHSLGITHGDVKADNVLLKSANTDRRGFFCKVSDFGLSRSMGKSDYIQTFTYGTITHMPPELLKDGVLTPAVDVYSFGMLLWELLSTSQPYPERNHGEIILAVVNEGRRPLIGPNYPEAFANLIRDCWKQSRHDRPTFFDIVRRLKQMLREADTSKNMRSVNDSAGSMGKLVSITSKPGSEILMQSAGAIQETAPTKPHKPKPLQDVAASMPEVRSNYYFDTVPSRLEEGKQESDALWELSRPPPETRTRPLVDELDDLDDFGDSEDLDSPGSQSSDSSLSDGFTSANSRITHDSDTSPRNENSLDSDSPLG